MEGTASQSIASAPIGVIISQGVNNRANITAGFPSSNSHSGRGGDMAGPLEIVPEEGSFNYSSWEGSHLQQQTPYNFQQQTNRVNASQVTDAVMRESNEMRRTGSKSNPKRQTYQRSEARRFSSQDTSPLLIQSTRNRFPLASGKGKGKNPPRGSGREEEEKDPSGSVASHLDRTPTARRIDDQGIIEEPMTGDNTLMNQFDQGRQLIRYFLRFLKSIGLGQE